MKGDPQFRPIRSLEQQKKMYQTRTEVEQSAITHEQRVRSLARLICAEKMQLLVDVYGERLPDERWQQYLSQARAIMLLIGSKQ
jgi:hypothetical protein